VSSPWEGPDRLTCGRDAASLKHLFLADRNALNPTPWDFKIGRIFTLQHNPHFCWRCESPFALGERFAGPGRFSGRLPKSLLPLVGHSLFAGPARLLQLSSWTLQTFYPQTSEAFHLIGNGSPRRYPSSCMQPSKRPTAGFDSGPSCMTNAPRIALDHTINERFAPDSCCHSDQTLVLSNF
jgi:hypothetical protein